jgi:hypothetical protein
LFPVLKRIRFKTGARLTVGKRRLLVFHILPTTLPTVTHLHFYANTYQLLAGRFLALLAAPSEIQEVFVDLRHAEGLDAAEAEVSSARRLVGGQVGMTVAQAGPMDMYMARFLDEWLSRV